MSYNGSGVFNINTAGQPVVTGTVISSTAFNALTADLATGLTTALTKDGQTTPTANIKLGGFKLTGIGVATTSGDALSYGQAATVSTLTNSALTSGRVPYASTAGLLVDSASLTYDGTTLTATTGANFATSSGNVGIGTTSPTAKLHVYQSASGSNAAKLTHVNGNGIFINPSYNYYDAYNHVFRSLNGTTTEMTLDSSGNVGIGATPTSNYRLSVSSSSTSINAIFAENTDASFAGDVVDINATRNATGGEYNFLVCSISGVAVKLKILNSGNVQNVNNSYGAISDIKLKENIVDATPKLANLMQVKVRNYNLINDTTKQIGVVAQELETIFPGMIDETPDYEDVTTTDEDGKETTERVLTGTKTKSVKYSVFVPMLIKAMQEQQAIIESLNARLTALESK